MSQEIFPSARESGTRWNALAAIALTSFFAILLVLIPQKPDRAALAESLRDAAQRGDIVAVRSALARGAFIDAPDETGATALTEAARAGRANVAEFLLRAGAHVDHRAPVLGTPLMQAAANVHPDVLRILLHHGANPSLSNRYGNSAMSFALLGGDAETIAVLRDAVASSPEFRAQSPQ